MTKSIGRTGSEDRVILRHGSGGTYLSLRLFGRYGIALAYGPRYTKHVQVRR